MTWSFAAEIYKRFLVCAAKVVDPKTETSPLTTAIESIFIGEPRNTRAVKAAMNLSFCVQDIINPWSPARYNVPAFVLQHVTGIDRSPLRAARTGVRGANDLVWVGRAANYAANLRYSPPGSRLDSLATSDLGSRKDWFAVLVAKLCGSR